MHNLVKYNAMAKFGRLVSENVTVFLRLNFNIYSVAIIIKAEQK